MTPRDLNRANQSKPLVRNARCFEFLVKYPWGTTAINGYRRAARHFGLHTIDDPTFEGSDAYRLFVDPSASRLRSVAASVRKINALDDGTTDDLDLDPVDDWLVRQDDLWWFSHDWKHWLMEDDESVLQALGWLRSVVAIGNNYRITLRLGRRRQVSRPRRRSKKSLLAEVAEEFLRSLDREFGPDPDAVGLTMAERIDEFLRDDNDEKDKPGRRAPRRSRKMRTGDRPKIGKSTGGDKTAKAVAKKARANQAPARARRAKKEE
jgi:hypothetical protein